MFLWNIISDITRLIKLQTFDDVKFMFMIFYEISNVIMLSVIMPIGIFPNVIMPLKTIVDMPDP